METERVEGLVLPPEFIAFDMPLVNRTIRKLDQTNEAEKY